MGTAFGSLPRKHLLLGRKRSVMEAEIIPKLHALCTLFGLPWSYRRYDSVARAGRQLYYLVAGNDASSADRVTGMTCHSALIDEATLVPETFFDMALGRLSFADSKAWVTCNPADPEHWLKREWIDKGKPDFQEDFTFEDNPSLSERVIARYRAIYHGVFAQRFIEGLWAAAEGVIYPPIAEYRETGKERALVTIIASDYGITNPSTLVVMRLLREGNRQWIHIPVAIECRKPENGFLTDGKIADQAGELLSESGAALVVVDPSAASLRAELMARGLPSQRGNNRIDDGIRRTGNLIAQGLLTADPTGAEKLYKESRSYVWGPGEKPLKKNDHFMDAMRYGTMHLAPLEQAKVIDNPFGADSWH